MQENGQDKQVTPEQMLRQTSTIARFSTIAPADFRAELDAVWSFGEKVIDLIASGVEHEQITPVQGVKVASCLAGTLLGYEEFHPNSAGSAGSISNALWARLGDVVERDRDLTHVA